MQVQQVQKWLAREFATIVESKVFEENEPALGWNRQMITMRKMQKKLPIIPVKQWLETVQKLFV